MVRDGAPCYEQHWEQESTVGWGINSNFGGLWSNGKSGDDEVGEIEPGQVLTMQVGMDAGTFEFWLDGKPHGPGY